MVLVPVAFLYIVTTSQVLGGPSVIIIGAGPSGIAAATKLLENNITNVTILEAEDRIGGRINTVKFGNGLVELGAEYCHGEEGNIVKELAEEFNVFQVNDNYLNGKVYYSNGSVLDHEFVRQLQDQMLFYGGDKNIIYQNYNTSGKSVGEVFMYRYNVTLLEKHKDDENKLQLLKEGLIFAERSILISEGAFSWFDSSADSDWEECPGNQTLVWKKVGYKTILEILMKSYPDATKKLPIDDKIHLNTKINEINWHQDTITVQSGNKTFSADYVIFTPSIGVLKAHKTTLFNPPLPPEKITAIDSTGFAGVIKLFLYFPDKWWKDDDKYFAFYWSEEDIKAANFPHGPRKNGMSWVTHILDLQQVENDHNVWMVWIGGTMVPEIEKIPLDTLKRGAQYVLERFFSKDYNVTQIGEVIRSNWVTNDNFLGTYSFSKAGIYQKGVSYQKELARPLGGEENPRVLFAGEATNPVHFSTVHGAIETGYREAERIIKLHSKV